MSSKRASGAKSKPARTGAKAKAKSSKPLVNFSIDVGKTNNGYYRVYFNAYSKNYGSYPGVADAELQVFSSLEELGKAVNNFYSELVGKL